MKNPFEKIAKLMGWDERPRADFEVAPAVLPVPKGRPNAQANISTGTLCPYCNSDNFVKRGIRQKKHEAVQLYLCRNAECGTAPRDITPAKIKL